MGKVVDEVSVGNKVLLHVSTLIAIVAVVLPLSFFVYDGRTFFLEENRLNDNEQRASIAPTPEEQVISATIPSPTPSATAEVTPTTPPVDNNNFSTGYDYTPTKQAKGTVRIPILTYHHIAKMPKDKSSHAYYVTPEAFEKQLAYLKAKNYKAVTSQEFYEQVKSGKNPKQKMVMLTFDDGNKDNYTNAYPLLKKYGFTGVFYINSKRLQISTKQLKEMANNGMVIDSHTATHMDLKKQNKQSVLNAEIITSKSVLEGITKKKVISVSYPGCVYDTQVINTAIKAGYKFGVSCGKSIDHRPGNLFALSRMHVYNDYKNFKKRLSGYWIFP